MNCVTFPDFEKYIDTPKEFVHQIRLYVRQTTKMIPRGVLALYVGVSPPRASRFFCGTDNWTLDSVDKFIKGASRFHRDNPQYGIIVDPIFALKIKQILIDKFAPYSDAELCSASKTDMRYIASFRKEPFNRRLDSIEKMLVAVKALEDSSYDDVIFNNREPLYRPFDREYTYRQQKIISENPR